METLDDEQLITNAYNVIYQEYQRRKMQMTGNPIDVNIAPNAVRFTKFDMNTFVRIISPRNIDANETGNWIASIYPFNSSGPFLISMPLTADDIDLIITTVHALFTANPGIFPGSRANPWTAIARLTSAVEQLSTYKK
jgi:hypothetical protein